MNRENRLIEACMTELGAEPDTATAKRILAYVDPPTNYGVGKWCAPGDKQQPRWLLIFDDADCGMNIYTEEMQARHDFNRAEGGGWNCYLFQLVQRKPGDDTEMLDFIANEYVDISSFEMPTGQGDADVGWKLVQHHQKGPVEVACVYRDDLRQAIREAMEALNAKNR